MYRIPPIERWRCIHPLVFSEKIYSRKKDRQNIRFNINEKANSPTTNCLPMKEYNDLQSVSTSRVNR